MAETTEAAIFDALMARLFTLSLNPALPVAIPNIAFSPPAGAYLEVRHFPNANINRGVSDQSSTEFRGIFQVSVMAPSLGGIVAANEIAGKIADHFERGAPISANNRAVKIEGRPRVAGHVQEPDRIRVPVSINYSVFA